MKVFWPEKLAHLKERELLGAGQYGLVYRVFNPAWNQNTMVKIVEAVQEIDKLTIKRFKREIRALQKADSPRIVKLLNYWLEPTFVAFEMEYIQGISVEEFIKKTKSISYSVKHRFILKIIHQLVEGLDALHSHDLVHRDIKPSNILIEINNYRHDWGTEELFSHLHHSDFHVKICDFGVVKDLSASVSITRTSDFIGTAAYVSPEQAEGRKISPASDMYSLGVLWYELITGTNPFRKKSIYHTINSHISDEPVYIQSVAPQVPLDIAHILMLLLQKEPNQRFYSSDRLSKILHQRLNKSPETDFDVSIVLENAQGHSETCEPFQSFKKALDGEISQTNILITLFNDKKTLEHALHHLVTQEFEKTIRPFYFLSKYQPDFLYSFTYALFHQVTETEYTNFTQTYSPDSIQLQLIKLLEHNDFNQAKDFVRSNFRMVSPHLKIYNWLKLISDLLIFVSERQQVILIFDSFDFISNRYISFLVALWQRLKNYPVSWLLPIHESKFTNLNHKINSDLYINKLHLDTFFGEKNTCQSFFGREGVQPGWGTSGNSGPSVKQNKISRPISDQEREFLEFFILSGSTNPVIFVNWLLENQFDRNSEIVVSLLEKKMLEVHAEAYQTVQFIIPNEHIETDLLNTIDERIKKKKQQIIAEFWDSQNTRIGNERLLTIFYDLKMNSRAGQILEELLNFYLGIGDVQKHHRLLPWIEKISRNYKLPSATTNSFQIHELIHLTYNGPANSAKDRALDLYSKMSSKYQDEKIFLTYLIIYNALRLGRSEDIQNLINNIDSRLFKDEMSKAKLDFLVSVYLYFTDDSTAALNKMSETLMKLNQNGHFWDIPTGSLIIAHILFNNKEWEKSYNYSAMAFQAARVLNDYWVMLECLELIEKNPYYEKHFDELRNWKEVFKHSITYYPEELVNQLDLRAPLFKFTH